MEMQRAHEATSPPWLLSAVGAAAFGAGLIHAAAIGPHNGHGVMPGLFALAAVAGLASGVAVVARPTRPVLSVVVLAHLVMVVTWVLSRTVGVGFVEGLETSESVGFPDAVAAGFEVVVVVVGGLWGMRRQDRVALPQRVVAAAVAPAALAVMLLCGPAVFVAATDTHGHDEHPAVAGTVVESAAHDHSSSSHPSDDPAGADTATPAGHDHGDAAAPTPFDPTKPIDLSGTPGVSQVQQKQAELLLAKTLALLPKYASQEVAFAEGYRSIGDASTGDEHLIKWSSINDDDILNPEHPESLVYDTRSGVPVLAAAMFILPNTYTLDTVPDIGGPLIQWHIHDNLCFTTGDAPVVAGLTYNGGCAAGLQKFQPSPMIHVWIRPNPCGPFASLEGVGAGQTKDGTRACDHSHGSSDSGAGTF